MVTKNRNNYASVTKQPKKVTFNATFCFELTHPFYLYLHPLKKRCINFPMTGNCWTAYLKL